MQNAKQIRMVYRHHSDIANKHLVYVVNKFNEMKLQEGLVTHSSIS
jgi:hypothetical protein